MAKTLVDAEMKLTSTELVRDYTACDALTKHFQKEYVFNRYAMWLDSDTIKTAFYEISATPEHYTAQYMEDQLNAVAMKKGFRFLRTTLERLGNGFLDSFEARGRLLCPCGEMEWWSGYFFDGGLHSFIQRLLADSITREHIEEDIKQGRLPPSALDAFDDQGDLCVSTDTPSD